MSSDLGQPVYQLTSFATHKIRNESFFSVATKCVIREKSKSLPSDLENNILTNRLCNRLPNSLTDGLSDL